MNINNQVDEVDEIDQLLNHLAPGRRLRARALKRCACSASERCRWMTSRNRRRSWRLRKSEARQGTSHVVQAMWFSRMFSMWLLRTCDAQPHSGEEKRNLNQAIIAQQRVLFILFLVQTAHTPAGPKDEANGTSQNGCRRPCVYVIICSHGSMITSTIVALSRCQLQSFWLNTFAKMLKHIDLSHHAPKNMMWSPPSRETMSQPDAFSIHVHPRYEWKKKHVWKRQVVILSTNPHHYNSLYPLKTP